MFNDKKLVSRTAVLLDLFDPNWYENINPYRLDLSRHDMCVIGQAFGNYRSSPKARKARKFLGVRAILPIVPAPFFAFRHSRLTRLENLWLTEIANRKAKGPYDERARFLRKRVWYTLDAVKDREETHA